MLQKLPDNTKPRTKPTPRLPRTGATHIEEGDGHLWAVSYADLLMVLMSFFVIFFSFKDETTNRPDGLLDLAAGLRKTLGVQETTKPGELPPGATAGAPSRFLDTTPFTQAGAVVWEEGRSMYLRFPDDIFAKREFTLNETTKAKISQIYAVLRPLQEKLEVVIVGHADSQAVSNTNAYLSDNFDLSSLRAVRSLQHLISLGFPAANASAQGSADGQRNSRSISIRIRLKELQS